MTWEKLPRKNEHVGKIPTYKNNGTKVPLLRKEGGMKAGNKKLLSILGVAVMLGFNTPLVAVARQGADDVPGTEHAGRPHPEAGDDHGNHVEAGDDHGNHVEGAEHQHRHRGGRGERGNSGRDDRGRHGGREDRPERGERGERGERMERPERAERPERPERAERPERPERAERPERGQRPERAERPNSGGGDRGNSGRR